ncbi:hypothetical protein SKAU_G00314700 [Synaphobranchus kaupii]|uniref:Uncharacterized protein n=1 Tax=Synaphobranchus kaupii TaxID=118154 RepID=A0A9Q1IKM8_SYNKA|nr:hypothetical protein SKAU_G00314700 [Synaphobranchus kaupii]
MQARFRDHPSEEQERCHVLLSKHRPRSSMVGYRFWPLRGASSGRLAAQSSGAAPQTQLRPAVRISERVPSLNEREEKLQRTEGNFLNATAGDPASSPHLSYGRFQTLKRALAHRSLQFAKMTYKYETTSNNARSVWRSETARFEFPEKTGAQTALAPCSAVGGPDPTAAVSVSRGGTFQRGGRGSRRRRRRNDSAKGGEARSGFRKAGAPAQRGPGAHGNGCATGCAKCSSQTKVPIYPPKGARRPAHRPRVGPANDAAGRNRIPRATVITPGERQAVTLPRGGETVSAPRPRVWVLGS